MAAAHKTRIIGIAGGSCSGKTTFARKLAEQLGSRCAIVYQDSYYIDQSSRFKEDGGEVNFDHPSALDFELMGRHLEALKNGENVKIPIYDFVSHSRKPESQPLDWHPIVLVDGTLILSQEAVLRRLDESIFIEASEEMRFERRKRRDTVERGRSVEGVTKQFLNHVKPMHDLFVEPSKSKATHLVGNDKRRDLLFATLVRDLANMASLA